MSELKDIVNTFPKGKILQVTKNQKAKISTDLIKFKEYYAIYADFIDDNYNESPCSTIKIDDKVALIIRNKRILLEMGLTSEERKAIYCHELGHCFSINQKGREKEKRNIDDEIDSDSFAVRKCGVSPIVLESALRKSYEFEVKNIHNKTNLTQERLDNYMQEMGARKRNVEMLIREYENERE